MFFGHELPDYASDRRDAAKVPRERFEHEFLARRVANELKGPGPDRPIRDVVAKSLDCALAHDKPGAERERSCQEAGRWRLERNAYRVVVDDIDRLDRGYRW